MVPGLQDRVTASAAAVRRLPTPTQPPPGPVDAVNGMLLALAAAFDPETQAALRGQQGWGTEDASPIPEVRTKGRWQATPELRRLTNTSPPQSLLEALRLLEEVAPCSSGMAALALISARLTDAAVHPGGVLSLARWYGAETLLRLEPRPGGTDVVIALDEAVSSDLRRMAITVGRAGYVRLTGCDQAARQRDYAIDREPRLRRINDLVVRADDRGSGLAGHVTRMLVHSPRPLTVAEIYGGLERHWRFRRLLLP